MILVLEVLIVCTTQTLTLAVSSFVGTIRLAILKLWVSILALTILIVQDRSLKSLIKLSTIATIWQPPVEEDTSVKTSSQPPNSN